MNKIAAISYEFMEKVKAMIRLEKSAPLGMQEALRKEQEEWTRKNLPKDIQELIYRSKACVRFDGQQWEAADLILAIQKVKGKAMENNHDTFPGMEAPKKYFPSGPPAPRATSLQAFRDIQESIAPGLRKEIYGVLIRNGKPLTSSEIAAAMDIKQRDSISPRMREMIDRKLIEECGTRICNITGREKIVYGITGLRECKPPERISRGSLFIRLRLLRDICATAANHIRNVTGALPGSDSEELVNFLENAANESSWGW